MEKQALIDFIRAVESDPGHAAYLLGLRHNVALQYHDVNVRRIGAMTDEQFVTEAPTNPVINKSFAEVERVAQQCVELAEALGNDANTLQAVELFQGVSLLAREARNQVPVTEAAMSVKCPNCGNEFAVKEPAEKAPAKESEEPKTEA